MLLIKTWKNLGNQSCANDDGKRKYFNFIIINYLVTESEVVTRKSQKKKISIARSMRLGRGLRFSIATERSRLLSYFLYGFLYKKKKAFQFKPNPNLHNP